MKRLNIFFIVALSFLSACDLQPKIKAIPDSVGDFISSRYPALLADPEKQPEIYNSAASDYGVYESADMYGTDHINDYTLYADADDYSPDKQNQISESKKTEVVVSTPPDYLSVPEYKNKNEVIVAKGDTLYSISREYKIPVKDLEKINNLKAPYSLKIGQKLKLSEEKPIVDTAAIPVAQKPKTTAVPYALTEITVKKGDTLYSLSREYQLPVNDLAVINKLSAPFSLSVGQKIKVPKTNIAKAAETVRKSELKPIANNAKIKKPNNVSSAPVPKISSDPIKPLPKITSRSSAKFTWPVRGKILSDYGAKSNGLYNDGVNISAKQGTPVLASENGVVAYSGNELKGMGNLIIVQHSDGWMTVYAHMDSLNVKRGARVSVGQKIGTVGKTGKVDSPQLHFEIRKGTKAYNPESKLK